MNNIKSYKHFLVLLLFLITQYAFCENYGFFVDGGYSPGKKDTDMDKLIDKRVDDAMDIMKKKDPDSDRRRFDKKEDLANALKNLKCKCGDVLTLYMVGHGSEDKFGSNAFEFIKEGKDISPSDLLDLLKKAAVECCCKINVVIFSCHSGAFFEKLFEDPHVMSVYTSCSESELSYSDSYYEDGKFIDGGDWIKGFNEDWEKDTNKTDWAKGLQYASETAKEKMPDEFTPKQHPQGWSRGEQEAYGHVVSREKDSKTKKIKKLKVHFYRPEYLRCKTKEVKIDSSINVSDSINTCKWIQFTMVTGGPKDPINMKGDPVITEAPLEKVLAHVEGGSVKKLKIHIISPKWLYCRIVTLQPEESGIIDKSLKACNWIEVKIKIKNPDDKDNGFFASDTVKAKEQTFKCKVHVTKVGKEKGIIEYHILAPPWLKCQNKTVTVPEGERGKLEGVDKCSNLIMNITFHPDGRETVSDIKKLTNVEGPKRFSLDAALQRPSPPVIDDSLRTYHPSIGVTNVGSSTISFPVYSVVCKLSEIHLINNWWRTGEGLPQGVWYNVKQVNNLEAAQTRVIDFNDYQIPPGSEIFWIGYKSILRGDENPSSDTASIILEISGPVNHPPAIENGIVIPDSGGISTQFNYRITYIDEDNDSPSVHDVLIDNLPYSMTPSGNNFNEGVEFNYQISLSEGPHSYSFRFDDGHSHPVTTGVYQGPFVFGQPTNHPPVLSDGNVQPDSGFSNTMFVYRVIYQDMDGDPPSQYQVFVDNNPFNMTPLGNNFTEGVAFIFQRNLSQGLHNFFFRFNDGHGHIVNTQNFTGPIVR